MLIPSLHISTSISVSIPMIFIYKVKFIKSSKWFLSQCIFLLRREQRRGQMGLEWYGGQVGGWEQVGRPP